MTPALSYTSFTRYEKLVMLLLALTQFTVMLDFTIMSPLGDTLMKTLRLTTGNFGTAVSAYAFSAGVSGLLTAGFADRFDRKKLLLFFYTGFIVGTIGCGLANSYSSLLIARVVTGLFGGVIASISMAIITDLFPIQKRGRVMGFCQMGFGASQILGIPTSLWLANLWGWEVPFLLTAVLATIIALVILIKMRQVEDHLASGARRSVVAHLWKTVANRDNRIGFSATALLAIGGFIMTPFGSPFAVNNLGVQAKRLPVLFMLTGICVMTIMPLVGKFSDKIDKFRLFTIASIWMMVVCLIYTHQSFIPFWLVILLNILMMVGILGRMVPSATLTSALPDASERGAFMSINASIQQMAGGIGAVAAGMIVTQQTPGSPLRHYELLGYVVVAVSCAGILLMRRVSRIAKSKVAIPLDTRETIIAEHARIS